MIAFQLSADTARFSKGMDEALRQLEDFTRIATKTQQAAQQFTLESPSSNLGGEGESGAAGGVDASASQVAEGAQAQAIMLRAALQSAIAPIGQIETRMSEMSNRSGGAMVTLARRIDNVMKGDKVIKQVAKVNSAIGSPFRAIDNAIKNLEQRFNVFGPTTSAAFGVIQDKLLQFRGWLDRTFRFDDLIGRWTRFVGSFRKESDSFGTRTAITGIQLFGSAILALVGKGVPAYARLYVAGRRALVQLPLMAVGGWMKLRNFMENFGDVARKGLDRLFNFKLTRPVAETQRFTSALGSVSTVASKAGTSVKQFGSQVAVALGFFGLAYKAVDFFKGGLKGASDLNETANKTGVIFGEQSATVGKAADDMASRFGMVKGEFMDASSTFGQLLQGMGGQTQKAAAETSVQLAKLAADASSIFNTSFDEASGKIASALRGQSEPISAFGIDVQEAATKAEAARMGIASLKGELTTAQKVAARTSLIMRGLAVAQGDLENTSEEPANAMRKFQGTMTNLANDIGEMFIPALKAGLGAANEFAQYLTEGFATAKEGWESFAASVAAGFDTVGVMFRNLPLVWEIAVLGFQEGILNILAHIETIPRNLALVGEYISGNWYQLITDTFAALGTVIKNFAVNLGGLFKAAFNWALSGDDFEFDWTPLLEGFKATAAELPQLLGPELVSMQDQIDAVAAKIAKNEEARAAKMKAKQKQAARPLPLLPTEDDGKKKKGKKQDTTAGAFVLGSQEAASAIAQYTNRNSKDAAAKDTAKNTGQTNKILQRIENKLAPAVRAGQPMIAKGL